MDQITKRLPPKTYYFKSENATPVEMHQKLIATVTFISRFLGCHLLAPDFSMANPMLLIVIADLFIYLFTSFHNIYTFRNDFVRAVFVTVTLCMGFQGVNKLYTFMFLRQNIRKLVEISKSFPESFKDEEKVEIFSEWLLVFSHVGYYGFFFLFGCAVMVFFYPAVVYVVSGEITLHFGFIIPGTDEKTVSGFLVNAIFQTLQIYVALFGLYIPIYYCVLFLLSSFALYDALESLLDDLGEILEIKDDDTEKSGKDSKLLDVATCISEIVDGHVLLLE